MGVGHRAGRTGSLVMHLGESSSVARFGSCLQVAIEG